MGLRTRLLEIPVVYELLQNGLSRPLGDEWLVEEVMGVRPGMRILDIGCGTADILSRLPQVDYLGIDHNPKYVEKSRSRFGSRGRFEVLDVNDSSFRDFGSFDIVLLLGVLHHLNDDEIPGLLSTIVMSTKPDGHLVTFDNALVQGQHPLARFLAKADRGRFARSPEEYRELIETAFDVESEIVRHDLLRIPYTHAIFRAVRKSAAATIQ